MNKFTDFLKNNKDSILKPTGVLLCICLVISLALAAANMVTAPKIAVLSEKQQNEAMSRLISADKFKKNTFSSDYLNFTYYAAVDGGEVIGYVFITMEKGYGGEVSVMTAVNPDGTVKAVDILDVSNETPGLGQNTAKEGFYSQFSGKTSDIRLKKNGADSESNEVNAVTGATITSTAVTKAVDQALNCFERAIAEDAHSVSYESSSAPDSFGNSSGGSSSGSYGSASDSYDSNYSHKGSFSDETVSNAIDSEVSGNEQ